MGQYLAIGLVCKFTIEKDNLEKCKKNIAEFEQMQSESIGYDIALYNREETDEYFKYSIKDEILENNTIPFLKEVYPLLYSGYKSEDDFILKDLELKNAKEILELAEDKPDECFQMDNYAETDYIDAGFSSIRMYYNEIIMLALEGKISMECYGTIFSFAKKCVVKAFPDQPLAKCLRVYITG